MIEWLRGRDSGDGGEGDNFKMTKALEGNCERTCQHIGRQTPLRAWEDDIRSQLFPILSFSKTFCPIFILCFFLCPLFVPSLDVVALCYSK